MIQNSDAKWTYHCPYREVLLKGMSSWKLIRAFIRRPKGTKADKQGESGRPSTICNVNNHGVIVDKLLGVSFRSP
jgi:hypothetical protein